MFESLGWDVVTLKYGRLQEAAFGEPGGDKLRQWIDDCPNDLYAALTFQGGAAWRARIAADLEGDNGIQDLLERRSDEELAALMTNLGGHDLGLIRDAMTAVDHDRPVCFIAYTIKGQGLPLQGHKDNHAGIMTAAQIDQLRAALKIPEGAEWEPLAGLDDAHAVDAFLAANPFRAAGPRRHEARQVAVPHIAP